MITEIREIKNGVLVQLFAKKNVENTLINTKAGKPRPKKYRALAELYTASLLKDPYPNNAEIICSDPIINAIDAGKLKNILNSNALF